ncbi:MAG TPA: hypothetical protein VFN49_11055 [Candidatus Aquilonibacter sp.]|nr:hypothetical protein [Candidatus Aquilonibacter sp.]
MKRTLVAAALAVACSTTVAMAAMMPNVVDKPTRFSGSCCVYTGAPALPVTLSMVIAGGGPSNFSTLTLVKALAGDKTDAEVASLKKKFGDTKVTNFVKVFNFVVSDTLSIVKAKGIALPSTPNPNPKDGKALAQALWNAGQTGNGFNVEVMLDRAVSHGIHDQVMTDIDKKFGIGADADYHAVLNQAMHDLATVYGFNKSTNNM